MAPKAVAFYITWTQSLAPGALPVMTETRVNPCGPKI